jgi:hypothetical protein
MVVHRDGATVYLEHPRQVVELKDCCRGALEPWRYVTLSTLQVTSSHTITPISQLSLSLLPSDTGRRSCRRPHPGDGRTGSFDAALCSGSACSIILFFDDIDTLLLSTPHSLRVSIRTHTHTHTHSHIRSLPTTTPIRNGSAVCNARVKRQLQVHRLAEGCARVGHREEYAVRSRYVV